MLARPSPSTLKLRLGNTYRTGGVVTTRVGAGATRHRCR